mgnify:CR=1 FL=1
MTNVVSDLMCHPAKRHSCAVFISLGAVQFESNELDVCALVKSLDHQVDGMVGV